MRDQPAVVLTRHFFTSLFDFGILSDEGAESLKRVLLGVLALAIAGGLLLTRVFMAKYGMLAEAPPEAYAREVVADHAFLMAVPMWIVAGAMSLVGQSLFPDETDFRILMAEPLSRSVVFAREAGRAPALRRPVRRRIPSRVAAARGAHPDRRREDGLGRPGGGGVRGVEPRRQPVRGARDRGHPRPARAARVAQPSAGVLGRGADRGDWRSRAGAAARDAPARRGRCVRGERVVAGVGAAGVVRGTRTLAARRHDPRHARGPGDGGDHRGGRDRRVRVRPALPPLRSRDVPVSRARAVAGPGTVDRPVVPGRAGTGRGRAASSRSRSSGASSIRAWSSACWRGRAAWCSTAC